MLSRRNVRGVACEIETVGEVVATRPAWLKLRLENRLKVGTAQALFFLHESLPGPALDRSARPRREARAGRRGNASRGGASIATRTRGCSRGFRWVSSASTARRSSAREIVVYPLPVATAAPEVPPEDARGGRSHPRARGGGSDIRTLREFSPGDDPRDLHWKQSARMRRWIVREREAERDRVLFLAIDNALAAPGDPAALERFESAVAPLRGTGAAAPLARRARSVSTPAASRSRRAAGARSGSASSTRSRAWRPCRCRRRRSFRRCARGTCGGSFPERRRADARGAAARLRARARAGRAGRAAAAALDGRRRTAPPSSPTSSASRWIAWRAREGRPVRLSDAAQNVLGLVYIAWLGYSSRHAADGSAAVGRAPAALHRPRQARVPEAAERGAPRPADRVPADARVGVVLDARVFASPTSSSMAWLGFRTLGAAGRPRGLRRRAARAGPDAVPTRGLSAVAIVGGALCGRAALLRAAATARPLRRGAVPHRRRLRQGHGRRTAWISSPSARPSAATASILRLSSRPDARPRRRRCGCARPSSPTTRTGSLDSRPRGAVRGAGRAVAYGAGGNAPRRRRVGRRRWISTSTGRGFSSCRTATSAVRVERGRAAEIPDGVMQVASGRGPGSLQRARAPRARARSGRELDPERRRPRRGPAVRHPADGRPVRPGGDLHSDRGPLHAGLRLHARPFRRRRATRSSTSCCAPRPATASTSRRRRR